MSRRQLLAAGFTPKAILHRLEKGRLHPVWRGVYAVGRPGLGREGRWMAAVLACGDGSALSGESAAAALGIRTREKEIEVSVPMPRDVSRPGIVVHRRMAFEVTRRHGIPLTTPAQTLVDLAPRLSADQLERAVNDADKLDLIDPETLRAALDDLGRVPGAGRLRRLLDRRTFVLTDSVLEQRVNTLARQSGLSQPLTGVWLNGYRVDFHWPDLGLIVETDGLRYHRTPAQQARDRERDQVHAAAGLTTLRFTHAQVAHEPRHVRATLTAVARRLRDTPSDASALRMGSRR